MTVARGGRTNQGGGLAPPLESPGGCWPPLPPPETAPGPGTFVIRIGIKNEKDHIINKMIEQIIVILKF